MIRILFNLFRPHFEALLVEDLLMQIPKEVSQPIIELMGARKEMMRKWVLFEANSILTRPHVYQKNPDRRQGMLIILRALLIAIGESRSNTETLSSGAEVPARKVEEEKPVDWQAGIRKFLEIPEEVAEENSPQR